jgi:hypothetical protein
MRCLLARRHLVARQRRSIDHREHVGRKPVSNVRRGALGGYPRRQGGPDDTFNPVYTPDVRRVGEKGPANGR